MFVAVAAAKANSRGKEMSTLSASADQNDGSDGGERGLEVRGRIE
jgi:hypothetical protein